MSRRLGKAMRASHAVASSPKLRTRGDARDGASRLTALVEPLWPLLSRNRDLAVNRGLGASHAGRGRNSLAEPVGRRYRQLHLRERGASGSWLVRLNRFAMSRRGMI